MRLATLLLFLLLSPGAGADPAQVVDIEVKGMSCPFCVYGVEKSLKRIDGVGEAEVDLKAGRARVVMEPGREADLGRIRRAITDSGFTPGKVTTIVRGGFRVNF